MRILIVTNVYPSKEHPYHGIFVAEQIAAIKRLHPEVEFDVHYINGFKGKWQYIKSIWKVSRRINTGSYDLVHIHYGFSGLYLLTPLVKKNPTITTFHGSDIQPKGGNGWISVFVSRIVAKHSDAAIVLNDDMDAMVKLYCPNTHMIPCAVDVNTFQPMAKTEKHEKVQVVFPSNHERQVKNYPLFCEVMSILKEKYGIEAEERELKNMTRKEIAQLYSNADVLLMTSNSEGSPQAVKEAMSCNLPCVSTPVGDVKVLLDGVVDSYVSKEHNAEELAALIVKSLKRDGKGFSGREQIFKLGVNEDAVADKVYELYVKLIRQKL